MNFKVYYYNLYKIENELDDLISNAKLLVELFNSTFNCTIDPDQFEDNKHILEDLLNNLKDKFSTIMILDRKTNKYEVTPFVILKNNTQIFIIYNNKIIKDDEIIKSILNEINYDINSDRIKPLADDEIVAIDYSTGKSSYIYDQLLLIDKKFNYIYKT